jgi:hypothetical protein
MNTYETLDDHDAGELLHALIALCTDHGMHISAEVGDPAAFARAAIDLLNRAYQMGQELVTQDAAGWRDEPHV